MERLTNFLGTPTPEISDKTIKKISKYQLDIKLGYFAYVLKKKKIKSRKDTGADEIRPEV